MPPLIIAEPAAIPPAVAPAPRSAAELPDIAPAILPKYIPAVLLPPDSPYPTLASIPRSPEPLTIAFPVAPVREVTNDCPTELPSNAFPMPITCRASFISKAAERREDRSADSPPGSNFPALANRF